MTKFSERVMMVRGDWRILRRARNYRSYSIQKRCGDGLWLPEPGSAPWDYYCNARARLRAIIGHAAYERRA